MTASVAACANHPAREAIGICVRCHKLVCSECVTRVDGINHCVGCLDKVGHSRVSLPAQPETRSGPALRLLLLTVLLALGLWGVLEAALPG